MSLIEILIISIGLSLDVYAVVVCQGAVLLNIEKSKLLKMSLFFLCLAGGCRCHWPCSHIDSLSGGYCHIMSVISVNSISVIIFTVMGAYMLYKAWKNEGILERLSDVNYTTAFCSRFLHQS